ncbi:MAG: GNAT family N-acetyltransferase [Planctomycetota bacterium]
MNVRDGSPADIAAVIAFDRVAATDAARVAMIEKAAVEGRLLVAEVASEVIGSLITSDRLLGHPFLELVYVKDGWRRRHVASTLVNAFLDLFSGDALFTSANESNTPSRRLFASLGFSECGRIEGLDEGDPEIFFCWRRATAASDSL